MAIRICFHSFQLKGIPLTYQHVVTPIASYSSSKCWQSFHVWIRYFILYFRYS